MASDATACDGSFAAAAGGGTSDVGALEAEVGLVQRDLALGAGRVWQELRVAWRRTISLCCWPCSRAAD